MSSNTMYDVLGISQSATLEEIRAAYRVRAAMFHPDRFSQSRQPKEWQLANEMLKGLNEAYDVLSEPQSRRDYDATLSRQTQSKPAASAKPSPSASGSSRKSSPSHSGIVCFAELPDTVKKKLHGRISGEKSKGFRFEIGSAFAAWFWGFVLLGWLVVLSKFGGEMHRYNETFWWMLGITAVVALLHGACVGSILQWHSSPCGCWLLLTPLHFVRVQFHEVRYWPIWEMEDFKCVHVHRNGSYEGTDFLLEFASGSDTFRLPKKRLADEFVTNLRDFDQKLRAEARNENWKYFHDEDDFADFNPPTGLTDAKKAVAVRDTRQKVTGYFTAAAVWVGLFPLAFGMASGSNTTQTQSSPATFTPYSPPPVQPQRTAPFTQQPSRSSPQPVIPRFNEPELTMPQTGTVIDYSTAERVAPFEIKSSFGSNYLVKLVDSVYQQPVLTVFVRGGTTVNIDVPLGNYIVKYAAGDRWYGYEHLFGPETGYSKAGEVFSFAVVGNKISGYTITLYKVRNGNLHTQTIRKEDF